MMEVREAGEGIPFTKHKPIFYYIKIQSVYSIFVQSFDKWENLSLIFKKRFCLL